MSQRQARSPEPFIRSLWLTASSLAARRFQTGSFRASPRHIIGQARIGDIGLVHDRGERIAGWVRKWNSGLTRFLERRVPARIDAQDLAQEVYLRLLRVEGFDSIAEPQAYLYRVATNVASEWRLRACNSRPHGAEELESLLAEASPEEELDELQFSAQLDAALRRLSPTIRGVLFLKLRDGLTHQQIAEQMGITPRVVRRCVSRGYLELREYLTTDRTTL